VSSPAPQGPHDRDVACFVRGAIAAAVRMGRASARGHALVAVAATPSSGLLAALARAVVDGDAAALGHVKHITSALGSMFATGFGALGVIGLGAMGQAKLSDHACVILFVLGGVSTSEAAAVAQEARARSAARALGARVPAIIVGATGIATAADAVECLQALCASSDL